MDCDDNRCYRGAMPLEQCFEIIEKGSGQDFDPDIAEVLLNCAEASIKLGKTDAAGYINEIRICP